MIHGHWQPVSLVRRHNTANVLLLSESVNAPERGGEEPLRVILALVDRSLGAPGRGQRPLPVEARGVVPVPVERTYDNVSRRFILGHEALPPPVSHGVGDREVERSGITVGRPRQFLSTRLAVLFRDVEPQAVGVERGELHPARVPVVADLAAGERGGQRVADAPRLDHLVATRFRGQGEDVFHGGKGHVDEPRGPRLRLRAESHAQERFSRRQTRFKFHGDALRPSKAQAPAVVIRIGFHLAGRSDILVPRAALPALHTHPPQRSELRVDLQELPACVSVEDADQARSVFRPGEDEDGLVVTEIRITPDGARPGVSFLKEFRATHPDREGLLAGFDRIEGLGEPAGRKAVPCDRRLHAADGERHVGLGPGGSGEVVAGICSFFERPLHGGDAILEDVEGDVDLRRIGQDRAPALNRPVLDGARTRAPDERAFPGPA